MQKAQVQSLGGKVPLEEGIATHSSILAWKIPWTTSLVGYSPRGRTESDTTEQLSMHTGSEEYVSKCLIVVVCGLWS